MRSEHLGFGSRIFWREEVVAVILKTEADEGLWQRYWIWITACCMPEMEGLDSAGTNLEDHVCIFL